jgi:streptogramin lyase
VPCRLGHSQGSGSVPATAHGRFGDEDGTSEQLELEPGTLTHPRGITVGEDGALYVTNNGDMAGVGEVLRIDVQEDEDVEEDKDDQEDED